MDIKEFDINYLSNKKENKLFEMVLREALEEVEINEDEVKLCNLFIDEEDDNVIASLAIINATKSKINFENLDLVFKSSENEESVVVNCDLRFLDILPSMTITPFEITIDKSKFEGAEGDINKFKVAFNKEIRAHKSVIIEGFDCDEYLSFEDKVQAKLYLKNMELLKENQVQLKAFNLYEKEDEINIPVMVINSYNKGISIKDFYVNVVNENNEVIAKKKITDDIDVKGNFAFLTLVKFNKIELGKNRKSYEGCRVVITT